MEQVEFANTIQALYDAFATVARPLPTSFCGHCFAEDTVAKLCALEARELDAELGRRLLWNLSHNDEVAARYFLPRLLELMAPPYDVDELISGATFDNLIASHFLQWPVQQRHAVSTFFALLEQHKIRVIERAIEEYAGKKLSYEQARAECELPYSVDEEAFEQWRTAFHSFQQHDRTYPNPNSATSR